ncbi:hypothetical protein [Candidatus Nitrososphaera evergladensis]|uniref:hypothetical protein n=1 Tax=Candidatus Nitrososphaera evergladensis TaxID=1459637 RepID=UPI0011E5AFAA|nr:hypothetical protein [Candidatus Nitrososphaera evergladensis]
MTTLAEQRKKIQAQLDALEIFRNTSTVRKLRNELKEELSRVETRISAVSQRSQKRKEQESKESRLQKRQEANAERSQWMKGVHRYVRLIHSNIRGTPHELPYGEVFKLFFERRRGRKGEIPDVIWQNPSP